MKHIVKGNRLEYDGDEFLQMIADIENFLVLTDDKLIVLLLNPKQLQNDRNVFCYGFDKEMKWQIPSPDRLHADNYYTSIYLSEDNSLRAYNVNGVEVTIDKQIGNILKKELIK